MQSLAAMPFPAHIEPANPATEARGEPRIRLSLDAVGVAANGDVTAVLVHDMSRTGLLIETESPLELGQPIRVALPEAGEVAATIVWNSGHLFGCRFDAALPEASLSAARLKNPIPATVDPLEHATAAATSEDFAARLRRLRHERGWSLASLAERSGLSKPSIWGWESGKAKPRAVSLRILAETFGVDESALRGGDVGGAADRRAASGALQRVVDASRQQIADLAGVERHRVKIAIEY
ncbi:MAG: helix-turn-helix domain-containing protein [Sphingopyxis solisilvae]|uniref:helix-turn-helix domain-containing protein n=1 Tax=Sphingopyxis solisilvae TaxID=1886788 RepID=UPI004036A9D2